MSWQEVSWSPSLVLLLRNLPPSFPTPAVTCVTRGSMCHLWTLFLPQSHCKQLPSGHPESWKWSGWWCGLPSGGSTWKEVSTSHRSGLGSFRQGDLESWAPGVWSRRGCAASGQAVTMVPHCLPGREEWPEEGHRKTPLKPRDLAGQQMILPNFLYNGSNCSRTRAREKC